MVHPIYQTEVCPTCRGRKLANCSMCEGTGTNAKGKVCENCAGRKQLKCWNCDGLGFIGI